MIKITCGINLNCEKDPFECGYSINCSSLDEYHFISGIDCPYAKWKKIGRAKEVGYNNEPIEIGEFPVYKSGSNLVSCRYNADSKCKDEEKRKECVEVSKLVLCEPGKNENVEAKHEENGE